MLCPTFVTNQICHRLRQNPMLSMLTLECHAAGGYAYFTGNGKSLYLPVDNVQNLCDIITPKLINEITFALLC